MKKTPMFKAVLAATLIGTSAIATGAMIAAPAFADVAASKAAVDAAKAQGVVGEANTGFLAFVSGSGDASLKAAVDEINAGRRDVYGQAAAKNGVSIEAAAGSAYTNIILPKVQSGEYYQDANGAWVRK